MRTGTNLISSNSIESGVKAQLGFDSKKNAIPSDIQTFVHIKDTLTLSGVDAKSSGRAREIVEKQRFLLLHTLSGTTSEDEKSAAQRELRRLGDEAQRLAAQHGKISSENTKAEQMDVSEAREAMASLKNTLLSDVSQAMAAQANSPMQLVLNMI